MPDDETNDAKEKGFAVSDRRVGVEESAPPAEAPLKAADQAPPAPAAPAAGPAPAEARPFPEITFPTFLLSLSTSALMHLGLIPNPLSGQMEKDLPLAKQSIDLLNLIRRKTQGNLEPDEAQLLDSILYDLRMKYVEARKE